MFDEVDTWYGLALLLEERDRAALERLRRAVERIVTGDRMMELPTSAVYPAEAEWRAGDEEAADRAADLALWAAGRLGSNHVLPQALADCPAVVTRRLDAEPDADSAWHELGRALIAQGVTRPGGRSSRSGAVRVRVRGDPRRRAAGATADREGVIRAYQGCRRALASVNAAPSSTTHHLLQRFRR